MKRGPEIKPPKFLSDLYSDLRDQRLLPLVIVLAVAIPVVPIIFSDPTPAFIPPAEDEGLAANVVDDSLMVVSAPGGIRRHGERLADRDPRDPFVDPNAPKSLPASSDGSSTGTPGPAAGTGIATDDGSSAGISDPGGAGGRVSPSPPSPSGGGSTGGSDRGPGDGSDDTMMVFRLKTSVNFGKAGSGLLHHFEDLDRMRGLPKEGPIAVFIGASNDATRAVFSISADASRVTGEGKCSSGRPKDCQFLTLRPGKAVNIHDARRGVVWRLAVTSIELVETEFEARGTGRNDGKRTGQKKDDSVPVAEPVDPTLVEATSLSEVIGLYLLK